MDSRVATLQALTDETSSVRQACQRMQLSYSSGWTAINLLERALGCQIVERTQGGSKGGRSRLTEQGRELLDNYERYVRSLSDMAADMFKEIFPGLSES